MDHVKSWGLWFFLLLSSQKFGGFKPGIDLMDHVKSWGFQSLLFHSSRTFGVWTGCRPDGSCKVSRVLVSSTPQLIEVWGSKPDVDLMDHVKSPESWFLLLRSSQKFGCSEPGIQGLSYWFELLWRPQRPPKNNFLIMIKASVYSWGAAPELWGFRTGYRPNGSCKVSRALVSSTPQLTEVGGFKTGVDLMDHVKSLGFWFLLLCSSRKFGGSGPGVDLMDHVKSPDSWFLLHRSSQTFGGSEPGVDLMDHVKSPGSWFLLLCSSWNFWGSKLGVDLMDYVKSWGFWFLLLCSSRKFGGSRPVVDLMDHVKSPDSWFLLHRSSQTFGGSEPGVDLMDHIKSPGSWFLLLCSSWNFWGSKLGVDLMDHVKSWGFWFVLLCSPFLFDQFYSLMSLSLICLRAFRPLMCCDPKVFWQTSLVWRVLEPFCHPWAFWPLMCCCDTKIFWQTSLVWQVL